MDKRKRTGCGGAALLLCLAAGAAGAAAGQGATIGFDLGSLNEAGLEGPPGGLRALDYEYCIPEGAHYRAQVAAIDPSARFMAGSPGRVGCGGDRVLVLGSTHQPGLRSVLGALAALPFVLRIERAVFE